MSRRIELRDQFSALGDGERQRMFLAATYVYMNLGSVTDVTEGADHTPSQRLIGGSQFANVHGPQGFGRMQHDFEIRAALNGHETGLILHLRSTHQRQRQVLWRVLPIAMREINRQLDAA